MVTMRDVARQAGVSSATVSHVLNGTRKVNAETAEAVRKAMRATGYVGDSLARAMRTGTTRTIGLAMSAISNPYFGDVVHAVEELLAQQDYSLLLTDTHDEPATERRAVTDLLQYRPAGIILAPSGSPHDVLDIAASRGVPVVCVDRVIDGVDSVGVENGDATERMVKHLISLGHKRIALVSGRPGLTTTDERINGYRAAMHAADLPTPPELMLIGDSRGPIARRVVAAALVTPNRPTAMMIGNNQMTIGAMQALNDAGLNVPHDMALAAFDDFEWADLFHPRLTTVAQPEQEMARAAVSLLFDRMANPDAPYQRIRLQPTLHHRESCGCDHADIPL